MSERFDKSLNRLDIIALAFGAMIGWGWVVLAGSWILQAGVTGAVLAFVIAGFAVILIGITYAELASSMPLTGGEHIYTHRALGLHASFICSWSILLGYLSVVSFEAVALPTVLEYIWPNYKVGYLWTIAGWDVYLTWVLVGMVGSVVITWVNIRGIKFSAFFQKLAVALILLVGIILFIGTLLYSPEQSPDTVQAPAFVDGFGGIMSVMIMVPFLFVGFDVIPQAAEEVDLHHKGIGKILVVSLAIAVVWYIIVAYCVGKTLPFEQAQNSALPTADAMVNAWNGQWAGTLLICGGILAILTSWNAFLIGGSRLIYAMAKARMLPAFLAKLHPKYKTPINAILLLGTLATIAPLFGRKMLVWIVDAGGPGIVTAYLLVAISFLILRKREPNMYRPFKVIGGYIIGVVAVILAIGMLYLYLPGNPSALTWPEEWLIYLGWMVFGVALYLYALKKYPGQSQQIMDEELEHLKAEQRQDAAQLD